MGLRWIYNANIKEDSNEAIVSKINEWIEFIKNDLSGEKEDIFRRIDENNSQVLNAIDKERTKQTKTQMQKRVDLPIIAGPERARSMSPEAKKPYKGNGNYISMNINSKGKRVYKGVFNKYSYLNKDSLTKRQPRYMLAKEAPKKEEIKNVETEQVLLNDLPLPLHSLHVALV